MTYAPANAVTAYVPTTRNFEVDETELRLLLKVSYSDLANAVNIRDVAIYDQVENLTGQQWYNTASPAVPGRIQQKRFTFRYIYVIPAIAAGGTSGPISLPLTNVLLFTRISGVVTTNAPDQRPVPHASVTANANIEVIATPTVGVTQPTITINVGAASPSVTGGNLILEYLKN